MGKNRWKVDVMFLPNRRKQVGQSVCSWHFKRSVRHRSMKNLQTPLLSPSQVSLHHLPSPHPTTQKTTSARRLSKSSRFPSHLNPFCSVSSCFTGLLEPGTQHVTFLQLSRHQTLDRLLEREKEGERERPVNALCHFHITLLPRCLLKPVRCL